LRIPSRQTLHGRQGRARGSAILLHQRQSFSLARSPLKTFKSKIDEELDHAQKLVAGGTPKANVYAVILKGAAPRSPSPPQPRPRRPLPANTPTDRAHKKRAWIQLQDPGSPLSELASHF